MGSWKNVQYIILVKECQELRYKYKNNFGDLLNVDHGILQGDAISPVPFSLCVNDLEHSYIISNCKDVSIQDLPMFLMRMTWFYSLTRLMVCKKQLIYFTHIVTIGTYL